jgi:hypothetical protein
LEHQNEDDMAAGWLSISEESVAQAASTLSQPQPKAPEQQESASSPSPLPHIEVEVCHQMSSNDTVVEAPSVLAVNDSMIKLEVANDTVLFHNANDIHDDTDPTKPSLSLSLSSPTSSPLVCMYVCLYV